MARRNLPTILVASGPDLMDRFWSHVEKSDGCWVWSGGRQKRQDGSLSYGVFCIGHGRYLAHHVSWIAENGPVPDELVLRHTCDNTPCVRPIHIIPGSQADNMADMRERGRAFTDFARHGEEHHGAKMTTESVRQIVVLRGEGLSLAKIGSVVGLHVTTVHQILKGRLWSEVTGIARVEPQVPTRVMVDVNGTSMTLRAACIASGANYKTVHARIRNGWPLDRALAEPPRPLKRRGAERAA